MSQQHRITLQASKDLFELNADYSQRLFKEMQNLQLGGDVRSEIVSLATGLAVIAHDLNEEASRRFLEKLLKQNCNLAIRSAFNSILRFKMSDHRITRFGKISILEEAAIDERYQATSYITGWLKNVPSSDLEGIPRIFILKHKPVYDFAGSHMTYLNVVTLVWGTRFHLYNPTQIVDRLFSEITLYHEIGHHCLNHMEFGSDPEQEKEANAYAYKLLGKTRPWLVKIILALRPIFRWIDRGAP